MKKERLTKEVIDLSVRLYETRTLRGMIEQLEDEFNIIVNSNEYMWTVCDTLAQEIIKKKNK